TCAPPGSWPASIGLGNHIKIYHQRADSKAAPSCPRRGTWQGVDRRHGASRETPDRQRERNLGRAIPRPTVLPFGRLTSSGSIFTQAALLSVQTFPTGSAQSMLSACPRAPA